MQPLGEGLYIKLIPTARHNKSISFCSASLDKNSYVAQGDNNRFGQAR